MVFNSVQVGFEQIIIQDSLTKVKQIVRGYFYWIFTFP